MLNKKKKYIADSILGGITIEDELIFELYQTKEFRRLGRINHLGIVHYLYPMAKHYRLEHSLGVYELTRRMMSNLKIEKGTTTYRAVLAAGLLHDIGHGPYSHLFELVSDYDHEEYSIDIIEDKNSEVYAAFEKIEPKAREEVIQILKGEHPLKWCNQIISSEIDMDRLDYLLRDATSTGAAYGQVDWQWLLNKAFINEETNELVFRESALPVIESMLLGRYHMNIAVYWNPKNVANQQLYAYWWKRMSVLYKEGKLKGTYRFLNKVLLNEKMTTEEFHILDDTIFLSAVRYSTEEDDEILRRLADMLLRQELPIICNGKDEVEKFVSEQDNDLEGQTWSVVDIATNFAAYQKVHAYPARILNSNDEIVDAVKHSTVINSENAKENSIKKIGVKV